MREDDDQGAIVEDRRWWIDRERGISEIDAG